MLNKTIFHHYTGSAFLNNALFTIIALGELEDVTEITPSILLQLLEKPTKGHSLLKLNKRLKSYTMIFTKNGPLHNDAEFGEKIYATLLKNIVNDFENEGDKSCELTGLKFSTTFEQFFTKTLFEVGYPKEKITGKDKTINRCWFPLIGGLGSDAQALPQAKFAVTIHPICLVIMQFLPLSSLIYKGGLLLIDTVNFDFSKKYIAKNTERVIEEIEKTKNDVQIENIKDFKKGDYILRGLQMYQNKEAYYDEYTDLNLWSYSNSGTGASCEIDRIPNQLFKKLLRIRNNPTCKNELDGFLKSPNANYFLSSLEAGNDFAFLYPAKNYAGVSIDFFETYQSETDNEKYINYAKYIAKLISEYKGKADEKILLKTDAYTQVEYRQLFYGSLVRATHEGKWSLQHHIDILDNSELMPINSGIYKMFKMAHFYYQNKVFLSELPKIMNDNTNALKICAWITNLIKVDEKAFKTKNDLINPQKFQSTSLFPTIVRQSKKVEMVEVLDFLYDNEGKLRHYGLLELLRIYYTQSIQEDLTYFNVNHLKINELQRYFDFATDYMMYYFAKYQNKETQEMPLKKFEKHVLEPLRGQMFQFTVWVNEAIENTNEFLKNEKWNDQLLYDNYGNPDYQFSKFVIEFALNKIYQKEINHVTI